MTERKGNNKGGLLFPQKTVIPDLMLSFPRSVVIPTERCHSRPDRESLLSCHSRKFRSVAEKFIGNLNLRNNRSEKCKSPARIAMQSVAGGQKKQLTT